MEARQQRIAEMARMLLPCVEDCRRKAVLTKNIFLLSSILLAFLGGYLLHENTRAIATNEHVILNSLIVMRAQEQHTTPELIIQELNKRYHIDAPHNLKARHWNDALNYLASKNSI